MKNSTFLLALFLIIIIVHLPIESQATGVGSMDVQVIVDSIELFDLNTSRAIISSQQEYVVNLNQNISIPLSIYRGKTLKRTIYLWVQDGQKRVSSKFKVSLSKRYTSYNISANLSFSKCVDPNIYNLTLQGIELNITKPVKILIPNCNISTLTRKAQSSSKISFNIIQVPSKVISGVPFKTLIEISNPTNQSETFSTWSYVYRYSKSYSGPRTQNNISVYLPPFSNKTITLTNVVNAKQGEYQLKVVYQKKSQKTTKEFKSDIFVQNNQSAKETTIKANATSDPYAISKKLNKSSLKITPKKLFSFPNNTNFSKTIYKSSSAKARSLTIYLMIFVLFLILAAVVFKRL